MKMAIAELSKLIGVSPSTISRVLTENPNVNEETRKMVREAIEKYNFVPMRTSKKKPQRKAVLVISRQTASTVNMTLFEHLYTALRPYSCMAYLACTDFSETLMQDYVEHATANGFSGIVLLTPIETPALKQLILKSKTNFISINRPFRSIDLDVVSIDNYRAGYLAAEYLIEQGHRKIACYAGIPGTSNSLDHISGFSDAHMDAGVPLTKDFSRFGDIKYINGYQYAKEILSSQEGYTAIFSGNHVVAQGIAASLEEEGLKIPEAMSLITISDGPIVLPGGLRLTTIPVQLPLLASTAANILADRINGVTDAPRKIVFPAKLEHGDSVMRIVPSPGQR